MESYLEENFGGVKAKNSSEEALRRWRKLCGVVKNPKRRFRFTANLDKRGEAQAIKHANHEKLRVAVLVSKAALQFIHGLSLRSEYVVPEEVKAAGFQICADELGSIVEGHDSKKLITHGGVAGIADKLATSPTDGLSTAEDSIKRRQDIYGTNKFTESEVRSFWVFVWEALQDTTLIILAVCAFVSLVVGIAMEGWPKGSHDGLGIVASILLVVFVTATSDYRQSLQFKDLDKEKRKIQVQVTRNGFRQRLSIYDLLPGDVVHLAIGDQVPADGLFIYATTTYLFLLLLLLSPLIATSTSPPPAAAAAAAAEQPQDLLLSFKASLQDPSNALSSWSPSTPYCNWSHITCTPDPEATSVSVSLSLQGLGLSGDIAAASLCRVPGLVALSLASNGFNQTIPLQLSRCTSLVSLNLSSGAFWGPLPDQLAMLASLTSLDLSGNDIEGKVPPGLAALRGLEVFNLGGNRLSGVLHPALFGNLTRLHFLDLSKNQFMESELPPELGEMASLRWLFLQGSGFSGSIPETFLGLEQLEVLDLSVNSLTGAVPPGFGLKFQKLLSLDLSQNGFSGPFPKEIEKCVMLQRFEVQGNAFTGELPAGLWSLPDLRVIRAENNLFSGRLPELPSGVSRLEQVQVDNNSFSGAIPQSIGLIRTMYRFSASLNEINGSLPVNFCDSPAMSIINISHNSLSGSIPEFKNCKRLVSLYLSSNGFTGPIPASLGDLPVLTYIDLSSNGLTGGIPAELQNLKLALFNVSYNQLSGRVPPELVSGLPAVFLEGNPGLCGPGLPGDCDAPLRKYQGLALAATVALFVTGVTLLAIGAFAVCRRLHCNKSSPWKLVLFYPIKITGEELFAAFHDKNVIGRGAFGNVYLIELQDGQNVAVKRLVSSGKLTFREVKNEMKVLAKIRHKNIAKMLGFCYSEGEVSIIYEYLQRGSLQDMIYAPKFAMGWNDRLRIALGVAQGLVYLHHDYTPCVLHRDLKSSNVLLADEFEPRVTGFGVDRVVGEKAYQSSLASGLNYKCYIAPEQNCTKNPTNLMDVYSFGVILLELITGKPAEQPASKDSVDIVRWVRRRINVTDGASQILDPNVSRMAQQGMQAALELAMRCTSVMPDQRPAMDEVVRSLQALYFSVHPQMLPPTEIVVES